MILSAHLPQKLTWHSARERGERIEAELRMEAATATETETETETATPAADPSDQPRSSSTNSARTTIYLGSSSGSDIPIALSDELTSLTRRASSGSVSPNEPRASPDSSTSPTNIRADDDAQEIDPESTRQRTERPPDK